MDDNRTATRAGQGDGGDSVVSLIRQLTEQGTHLAQQQVELIRAEVSESISDLKVGAAAMAGAAIVGIAALGVLLMALAYGLAEVMDLWLATLIVAIGSLLVAYLLFLGGRKKMGASAFDVERSRRTMKRTPDALAGHISGSGTQ